MNRIKSLFPLLCAGITFACLYFLNAYHMMHQEQMQLFRFDMHSALLFLKQPGGISEYIGAFFTQFFLSPLLGSFITVMLSVIIYFLLDAIFKAFHIAEKSFLAAFPAVCTAILLFSHDYHLASTIALTTTLALFYLYTCAIHPLGRHIAILLLPSIAFITSGGFWIWLALMAGIYEYRSGRLIRYSTLSCFIASIIFVFITYHVYYIVPPESLWKSGLPGAKGIVILAGVLLYIPVIVFIPSKIRENKYSKALLVLLVFTTGYYAYEYRTEKLFEIEHFFYQEDYTKVVELAEKYPGNDHLVVYMGNIALSETLEMGNKLFHIRQLYGPQGLYMADEPLNIATLYGGELYHHLRYTGEACHWTYNGMIVNGMTPRLLKHLVLYELANRNYEVAKKYLAILSQTIFYREWAVKYYRYVKTPLLILSDDDIADLRKFQAYQDFYHDRLDRQLNALLALHPGNDAAFNYLVAHALLKKDLKSFLSSLQYLKEFNMARLPIHYEEALLVCKIILPESADEIESYRVSDETRQRFNQYVQLFESAQGDTHKAYQNVFAGFRHTFWFYLDFFPYIPAESESNTQLFPY